MNDYKFGNFLCELRTEKGLSQTELGDMFGVSNKAVSKWEMGISKPRPAMLLMLSSFFGVTVEELLAGEKNERTENEPIEKDDTAMKIWTGEYRKKKKHAKNAVLSTLLFPFLLILLFSFYNSSHPDNKVVSTIVAVILILAVPINIALIFVFYGSARRLKRILYATYPEKAEDITSVISPKREKFPMLKWEKICSIGSLTALAVIAISFLICGLTSENIVSQIIIMADAIFILPALIVYIVAMLHYYYRFHRKK